MHSSEIYDVTIIGGGPTGMFAAFYAGIRELKVKIIETLPVLGGQVEIMYPEKKIYDVGAFPYIKGADLIKQLHKQMEPFEQTICLEENVLTLDKEDDYFIIKTDKGTHYSKTILIATGQGSFEPRKLTFDYPKQYEQTKLHYRYHRSLAGGACALRDRLHHHQRKSRRSRATARGHRLRGQ